MQTNSSNGQLTAQVNIGNHQKSGFDLSNNVLGTGKIGRIIPTRALHVMPGDTVKQDTKVAVQFEPLAVPILANMDVRQEHFYVPYNIVWQNWDKFISGGERLQYNGKVPSVSMGKIVETIKSMFSNVKIKLNVEYQDNAHTYNFAFDETQLNDFREPIEPFTGEPSLMWQDVWNIGGMFYATDLLKPMRDALVNIYNLIPTLEYRGLFFAVTIPPANINAYLKTADVENDKYMIQLKPQLQAMLAEGKYPVIPSDSGMKLLHAFYEFYKPLIGIGSNLDYLNMSRITFVDFLYAIIRHMSSVFNELYSQGVTLEYHELQLQPDYFSDQPLSILNLRANYAIWYWNYRDILLEDQALEPVTTDSITQQEIMTLLLPRQRCWEKDMFTTALDNPGTGYAGVPVGLQLESDMPYRSYMQDVNNDGNYEVTLNGDNVSAVRFGKYTPSQIINFPSAYLRGISTEAQSSYVETGGFSLYQLDAAQRAQKWLQKALYFGNRINDFYYLHFGVKFLDARLRVPELLSSSKELVKLDVIMNNTNITTEANGEVYQSVAGDRAAYASAYDNGNSFDRFCEEHGVIMSYLTIMPQVTYAYGINRDYNRLDQFDFAFQEFATLGMDAIYDTEISSLPVKLYTQGGDNPKIFGYQGRYYDYKAKHSEEHGELLDSQDMYTFGRKFNMFDPEGRPKLNYEFVHCFPPLDMFVVDDSFSDYFRYDIRHSTACERLLPSQSIYI